MKNLRRLREQAKLTRYELQRDSGVSVNTIISIEMGSGSHTTTALKLVDGLAKHLPRSKQDILLELLGMEAHDVVIS